MNPLKGTPLPPPKRALRTRPTSAAPTRNHEKTPMMLQSEGRVCPEPSKEGASYGENDDGSSSEGEVSLFTFERPVSRNSHVQRILNVGMLEVERLEVPPVTEGLPPTPKKTRTESSSILPMRAEVKEIRQSEQLNMDEDALMNRLMAEEMNASHLTSSPPVPPFVKLSKPSGLARTKNHISSLAYQVYQKEKEINDYHAAAKATQNETKSKYGF
jgi:Mitotic checkpoint regulator, MAD2B-interacting